MFQAARKQGQHLERLLSRRRPTATSCTKRVRHTNLKKQGIRLSSARLYNAHLLNFFHVSGRAKKKGNILSGCFLDDVYWQKVVPAFSGIKGLSHRPGNIVHRARYKMRSVRPLYIIASLFSCFRPREKKVLSGIEKKRHHFRLEKPFRPFAGLYDVLEKK